MNHFKKSYKAIVKYFLQKLLGFSNIMCVFLSLKRRDDPIWYGTLSSLLVSGQGSLNSVGFVYARCYRCQHIINFYLMLSICFLREGSCFTVSKGRRHMFAKSTDGTIRAQRKRSKNSDEWSLKKTQITKFHLPWVLNCMARYGYRE